MNIPNIINEIYTVFKDYYGEDKVDLQTHTRNTNHYFENIDAQWSIIVHWPEVTVTNEFDESVIIWNLYSNILLDNNGKLMQKPLFNRTEYNQIQWVSDYAHSHLYGINKRDLTEWRDSCLGSGPINTTIAKLQAKDMDVYVNRQYTTVRFSSQFLYTDMDIWRLFIWELDKYVHVESIEGVPYRKIRNIGVERDGESSCYYEFSTSSNIGCSSSLIQSFLKYIIDSKILKYNYINNSYNIGMSFTDTVITLSNLFIEWYNKDINLQKIYPSKSLYNNKFIEEVYIIDNKIFYKNGTNINNIPLMGKLGEDMFTFKGETIKFTVNDINSNLDNTILIVNLKILGYIIYKILRFINCKYGKSEYTISSKTRVF